MILKYKVYDIDYCVEDENVCEQVDVELETQNKEINCDDYQKLCELKINEIKSNLPKELIVEINEDDFDEGDYEAIEDYVVNEATERTGWLINGCSITVLDN